MSGFHKSRIVGVSSDDLDEFLCGICQLIINNPLVTHCCRQSYCKACIEDYLSIHNKCPNELHSLQMNDMQPLPHFVVNFFNDIEIKCQYEENGCKHITTISELTAHQKECQYRPNIVDEGTANPKANIVVEDFANNNSQLTSLKRLDKKDDSKQSSVKRKFESVLKLAESLQISQNKEITAKGSPLELNGNDESYPSQKRLKSSHLSAPIGVIEDKETRDLVKILREILNKTPPQKYRQISKQIMKLRLKIDTEDRLQRVVDLIYEKTIEQPVFSIQFAMLCKHLSPLEVMVNKDNNNHKKVFFHKLLVEKCENEIKALIKDIKKREVMIGSQIMSEILNEDIRINRNQSLGNIKLIGALFMFGWFKDKNIIKYMKRLYKKANCESLELLCVLIRIVGERIQVICRPKDKGFLSDLFVKMGEIADQKDTEVEGIPNNVRLMLREVIDMRNNNWKVDQNYLNLKKEVEELVRHKKSNEEIEYYISTHFSGSQITDFYFTNALFTAVISGCIDVPDGKDSYIFEKNTLQMVCPLLSKFLGGDAVREFQALIALQELINDLEHPTELLFEVFQVFTERGVISKNAFLQWENSHKGKALPVKSVSNNFEIKCQYEKNGCKYITTISELTAHQKECQYRPNVDEGTNPMANIVEDLANNTSLWSWSSLNRLDKKDDSKQFSVKRKFKSVLKLPESLEMSQNKEITAKGSPLELNGNYESYPSPKCLKSSHLSAPIGVTEDKETQGLLRILREILNKTPPQKYLQIHKQVINLKIDTEDRFQKVVDLIYEKAIEQPVFSFQFAKLCKCLSSLVNKDNNNPKKVKFQKLLVEKCDKEFDTEIYASIKDLKERQVMIERETDSQKKKIMSEILNEDMRRARIHSLGNIKLIGRLFMLGMFKGDKIFMYISGLYRKANNESLELLCVLIQTVRKQIEVICNQQNRGFLSDLFVKMGDIADQKDTEVKGISNKVRLMLREVIDLRNNNWKVDQNYLNLKKEVEELVRHKKSNDEIDYYIFTHISGPQITDFNFTNALFTAVISGCIDISDGKDSYIFEKNTLQTLCPLLSKFLGGDAEIELKALIALQELMYHLEHPTGLLHKLFQVFYDNKVISKDAFLRWEKWENSRPVQATAVISVISFLTWLKEN